MEILYYDLFPCISYTPEVDYAKCYSGEQTLRELAYIFCTSIVYSPVLPLDAAFDLKRNQENIAWGFTYTQLAGLS